eukprot:g71876.t1
MLFKISMFKRGDFFSPAKCALCLEVVPMRDGVATPCNHSVHKDCLPFLAKYKDLSCQSSGCERKEKLSTMLTASRKIDADTLDVSSKAREIRILSIELARQTGCPTLQKYQQKENKTAKDPSPPSTPLRDPASSKTSDNNPFAAGKGYGTNGSANYGLSTTTPAFLDKKAKEEQALALVLARLLAVLRDCSKLSCKEMAKLEAAGNKVCISRTCLLPFLEQHLRGVSVLELESSPQNMEVLNMCLEVIELLQKTSPNLLAQKAGPGGSVVDAMGSLKAQVKPLVGCPAKSNGAAASAKPADNAAASQPAKQAATASASQPSPPATSLIALAVTPATAAATAAATTATTTSTSTSTSSPATTSPLVTITATPATSTVGVTTTTTSSFGAPLAPLLLLPAPQTSAPPTNTPGIPPAPALPPTLAPALPPTLAPALPPTLAPALPPTLPPPPITNIASQPTTSAKVKDKQPDESLNGKHVEGKLETLCLSVLALHKTLRKGHQTVEKDTEKRASSSHNSVEKGAKPLSDSQSSPSPSDSPKASRSTGPCKSEEKEDKERKEGKERKRPAKGKEITSMSKEEKVPEARLITAKMVKDVMEEGKASRLYVLHDSLLSKHRFKTQSSLSQYHYAGQAAGVFNRKTMQRLAMEYTSLRLAMEYTSLRDALPLHFNSSAYMRVSEDNSRQAQLMIMPHPDTPYGHGCFLFDVLFPENYPNASPKVNLQTTGRGSVRFNPNLYNCGKVCLSLLGTWSGSPEEQWNPKVSTFLQVCISLQSLVFIEEPYYNEPGYSLNPEASKSYNSNIRARTVEWAMIDMLKNPPTGFKDVVQMHFYTHRKAILEMIDRWTKDGVSASGSLDHYRQELKTLLEALEFPTLQEEEEDKDSDSEEDSDDEE